MRWILFGAVGALAFAVHFGVAVAVVEWGHGAPGVGNVVGYLCALGTSWLGQSRLTFTDGTRTYSVAPSQPYAIPGDGATQTLTFRSKYVPAAFTPGSH